MQQYAVYGRNNLVLSCLFSSCMNLAHQVSAHCQTKHPAADKKPGAPLGKAGPLPTTPCRRPLHWKKSSCIAGPQHWFQKPWSPRTGNVAWNWNLLACADNHISILDFDGFWLCRCSQGTTFCQRSFCSFELVSAMKCVDQLHPATSTCMKLTAPWSGGKKITACP